MRKTRQQIQRSKGALYAPRKLTGNMLALYLILCCGLSGLIGPCYGATLTNRRSLPFSARSLAVSSSPRKFSSLSSSTAQSSSRNTQPTTVLCSAKKSKPILTRSRSSASEPTFPPRKRKTTTSNTVPNTPLYFIKVALAGGIAGAVGSAALYPMDAAKTLRQSNPSEYSSVFQALGSLISTRATINGGGHLHHYAARRIFHLQNVYRGVLPATLGAIPSSALYFGAYESMKTLLTRYFPLEDPTQPTTTRFSSSSTQKRENNFANRLLVHGLAAVSGNVLSSAVFVPKELIKQQLQYRQAGHVLGVVVDVLKEKGMGGLYVGYKATLLRNVPTAVLRFSLYEEFRYRWYTQEKLKLQQKYPNTPESALLPSSSSGNTRMSPKFFLAGALAGAIASGLMTPVDVLKTRLATGTCPVDVKSCFLLVVREEGIKGLYSGAGARMVFSGAFSAIGFGTFEWAKATMGVSSASNVPPVNKPKATIASAKNISNRNATPQKHGS